ncbi:MAG: toxin-antitoxin system HicB family antitoxin [Longimicrobiales bacterium]|nr:toxin-antitoxin system HicB family antitoxin [Longimicrobiales bacterium]
MTSSRYGWHESKRELDADERRRERKRRYELGRLNGRRDTDRSRDPGFGIDARWSQDNQCFEAKCPELPQLIAVGDSASEAVSLLEEDIEDEIGRRLRAGEPIPEPRLARTYSGQLRVRLPKLLHEILAGEARRERVSLNTWVITTLASALRSG